jgi:hypothetical protein
MRTDEKRQPTHGATTTITHLSGVALALAGDPPTLSLGNAVVQGTVTQAQPGDLVYCDVLDAHGHVTSSDTPSIGGEDWTCTFAANNRPTPTNDTGGLYDLSALTARALKHQDGTRLATPVTINVKVIQ